MSNVYHFPGGRVATGGASWGSRMALRMRHAIGVGLRKMGMPGMIRPVEINDPSTGQTILVSTGPLFTRVQVNGRDYYFDRFTGQYDGTGQGCR